MRTPLQAILGYSEIGKINAEDAGRVELASYFDSIQMAGNQMNMLVENLLTLASKSWDEHANWDYSQNQDIDVADFAHAVGTLMELRARKLGQTLTSDIQLSSATMRGDPARLQQVFEHLLGNALRYSGKGSKTIWCVSKSLPTQKSESTSGEFVQFEIIDQGCGIPENEIKVVFEPFYQSTRTGTGAGGTGLGLPLSQCIVGRHGGSIKLENRANGGLSCQVLLPLIEVSAAQ
jgi:signal transduction histidine kinase